MPVLRSSNALTHYLSKLWDEAGLARSELYDEVSGDPKISVTQALGYLKDELTNNVLPATQASILQAKMDVFESEVHDIMQSTGATAEELHGSFPRVTFGSALDRVSEEVRNTLPPGIGTRAYFDMPTVPDAGRKITSADLGPVPADLEERWKKWEYDVELALQEREGENYVYDPFNTRVGDLHWRERDKFKRQYEEIIGSRKLREAVEGVREEGLGPTLLTKMYDPVTGVQAKKGLGRWAVETTPEDLRTYALARMNMQYLTSRRGVTETAADMWSPSGRIARLDMHLHTRDIMQQQFKNPGKTIIFDVETAGLDPQAGIWQLAAHMVDENGKVIESKPFVWHFNNAEMEWKGQIGNESLASYANRGAEKVEDFSPESIKDFLQMVNEADYVGGHNIFFDYNMLIRGLKSQTAYDEFLHPAGPGSRESRAIVNPHFDREYHNLVNGFIGKFYNKDTGALGNVIDTHLLAQTQLPTLELAPELQNLGKLQPYSLENILLQTNLYDRLVNETSQEQVDAWFQRGLHFADVDVPIESHLMAALREMITGNGPGLEFVERGTGERGRWLTGWHREAALQSSALTPLTHLTKLDQIHDSLVEPLLQAGLIEFDPKMVRERGFGDVKDMIEKGILSKEDLKQYKLDEAITKINFTPMEQRMAASRKFPMEINERVFLSEIPGMRETWKNATGTTWKKLKATFWDPPQLPDRSVEELAFRAGMWNRIAAPWTTKDRGLISRQLDRVPVGEHWEAIQNQLAEAGIPFAHSSFIERHLMSAMGQSMGPNLLGTPEGAVRELYGAEVASMGRWMAADKFGVVGADAERRIFRIPVHVLAEAEEAGVFHNAEGKARTRFASSIEGGAPELFALSPFEYADKSKEIGVMFRFAENAEQGAKEREALLGFIHEKYGSQLSDEVMNIIRESLENTNAQNFGVQVATFGAQGGKIRNRAQAARLHDAVSQISPVNVDRGGENTALFLTAYAPLRGEEQAGAKHLHTVGIFGAGRLLTPEELEGIGYHSEQARRIYEQAMAQVKDKSLVSYIASLAGRGEQSDTQLLKAAHGYLTVRKRAPLLALGAATIGGIGYKIHKNHKNRLADQVMEIQPYEDQDWYDDYERDMNTSVRPVNYRQSPSPNPLSTAGLMKTLDRRKVNHTNMSSDKYGYLFSRGYS